MKYLHLTFVICLLVITAAGGVGCAKTVTSIVPYGEQITVAATLRGAVDVANNRYFLVLSNSSSYKVPLPRPDIIEATPEFIEPGLTPIVGTAEAYYSAFFSTWSSYFVIDSGGYTLVKGPFSSSTVATREVIANLDEATTTLNFTCQLSRIFGSVPDQIYFDFVAVPWPAAEQTIPADHLPSIDNYISSIQGSIAKVTDSTDSDLDPGLDILSLQVEIQ
ncbi:MAG: hypothetical protein ABIH69_00750 [bacterium]